MESFVFQHRRQCSFEHARDPNRGDSNQRIEFYKIKPWAYVTFYSDGDIDARLSHA